ARPRQPSTKPRASRRMDLPAPVSPVSTFRPGRNDSSSRSMMSMSRISSPRSIPETPRGAGSEPGALHHLPVDVAQPALARGVHPQPLPRQQAVAVAVEGARLKVVAENRGGG